MTVGEAGGVELPDEETFVMPDAWHARVIPRRGGARVDVGPPRAEAADTLARWTGEHADWIAGMLASPAGDPRIAEAARAHLGGAHSPLGAAALAHLTWHDEVSAETVLDAWVLTHGTGFAARAVMEHFGVEARRRQRGAVRPGDGLVRRPADRDGSWTGVLHARRLRALLSVAEEDAYREAVAALAPCRSDARRRVVVSYLVPSETGWADECSADPAPADQRLRTMALASLSSPDQVARFVADPGRMWNAWDLTLLATVAEGVGKGLAPLMHQAMEGAYGTDRIEALATALVEVPADDTFRVLLGRVADRHVRPQLQAATRRYPVRALRLLGAAAQRTDADTAMVRLLLDSHVRSHPEIAAAVLPELDAGTAALVEPLLDRELLPEAPAGALPPLLADPPWAAGRRPREPRVAAPAPAAPEPRVDWADGEQGAWAGADPRCAGWRREYDWSREIGILEHGGTLRDVRRARLFVDGAEDVAGPLPATWTPDDHGNGEASLKPLAARFGADALPLLLRASARQPATLGVLLLPYLSAEVAGQVCDWLVRLRSAAATARTWVARHGLAAVPYLVPHAVGPAGPARAGAERALRQLVAAHGAEAVDQAVAGCGEEAAGILAEVLAADPLESALPLRMPVPGAWTEHAPLPQLVLTTGGALPAGAVRHVLTVLALSKDDDLFPGVDVLREACTAQSLTTFAWALFEQWQLAGMPAADSWALHALGWFGDDDTVRRLTPLLHAWPGQDAHHRAVEGLDVLASIGSHTALTHLHGVAQRVPFKALKARAREKMAEVAEGLGLTAEQLGDRLVPDLGLDPDGSTVVDYGPRRFTVGFDEQLRPYVVDADGKRRKTLPAPGAKDDPELAPAERKRFAALKKDVRTVGADQIRRLEAAMVAGRTWTAGEFRELLVAHPLLGHLVRRLVWLGGPVGDPAATTAFRVTADGAFADAEGKEVTAPDDMTVRLPHPLHLGDGRAAWERLFADRGIAQPFPQLARPVHTLTGEEAASHRLTRFEGATVPVGRVLGLTRRGWQRGEPLDNGVERWLHRQVGDRLHLVVALDEGIAVGNVDVYPDQTFETVWLGTVPGDYLPLREPPLRLGDLDPVIASEVLADLTEVTATA